MIRIEDPRRTPEWRAAWPVHDERNTSPPPYTDVFENHRVCRQGFVFLARSKDRLPARELNRTVCLECLYVVFFCLLDSHISAVTEKITGRIQDTCPGVAGETNGRAKKNVGNSRMDIYASEIGCECEIYLTVVGLKTLVRRIVCSRCPCDVCVGTELEGCVFLLFLKVAMLLA